jgi:hypothetical protein
MESTNEWIDDECLPVKASLRVVRSSRDYGLSVEEVSDRDEFIRCHLLREHELLMMIPAEEPADGFFVEDFRESAFNTHDFQRQKRQFDRQAYAVRKVLEHLREVALMHSCISSADCRANVQRRFDAIVEDEFQSRLLRLVELHSRARDESRRRELKRQIGRVNRNILECRHIWESVALPA